MKTHQRFPSLPQSLSQSHISPNKIQHMPHYAHSMQNIIQAKHLIIKSNPYHNVQNKAISFPTELNKKPTSPILQMKSYSQAISSNDCLSKPYSHGQVNSVNHRALRSHTFPHASVQMKMSVLTHMPISKIHEQKAKSLRFPNVAMSHGLLPNAIQLAARRQSITEDASLLSFHQDTLMTDTTLPSLSLADAADAKERDLHNMLKRSKLPEVDLATMTGMQPAYTAFANPADNSIELNESLLPRQRHTGNITETNASLMHESVHIEQISLAIRHYKDVINPTATNQQIAKALKYNEAFVAEALKAGHLSPTEASDGDKWYQAFHGSDKPHRDNVHKALNLIGKTTKSSKTQQARLGRYLHGKGFTQTSFEDKANAAYTDLPEESHAFSVEKRFATLAKKSRASKPSKRTSSVKTKTTGKRKRSTKTTTHTPVTHTTATHTTATHTTSTLKPPPAKKPHLSPKNP